MPNGQGPRHPPSPPERDLAGAIVFVAEDNVVIGMMLLELLSDAGCIVLGPVASVVEAQTMLNARRPDVALLDHALADGTAEPVVQTLDAASVPYALLTGEDAAEPHSPSVPVLRKPFGSEAVYQVVAQLLRATDGA